MRILLLLLALLMTVGCSKSWVRQPKEEVDDPRDTRTETQKLEDRLGV